MREDRYKKEERLYTYEGEDRIVSSHEIKEAFKNENKERFSTATGVPTLDRLLDNVEPGELIVVTGPTGNGKTTLLQSITHQVASEVPVAWFTLEVTPRQFIAKFGANLPLFYMPSANTESHIDWLIDRIVEANVKHNVKMVFIDHLHQIMNLDHFNGKNLSLEIGEVVSKLKDLAIQYDMTIWLIAHGTDDKERINREPRMTDVRDSGMIIRLADIVMGVWRIPNSQSGKETTIGEIGEDDTKTKVRVWKNRRNGKLGFLAMNFVGGKLVEVPLEDWGVFDDKDKATLTRGVDKQPKLYKPYAA